MSRRDLVSAYLMAVIVVLGLIALLILVALQ
jgi:hypothetical protein